MTLTAFQPLYGKLSDIFGRKACLLFAYAVFGVGCLCCGLARNINQLIAARALAGIGGGGMTTVVSILMSDIIPLRDRGQWQGYLNIIHATGSASGAPLGGLLADSIGWRWAFLSQAPLSLLAMVAVGFTLKMPTKDDSNWVQKLRRIDFIGAITLMAAVVTLLIGLDRGSNVTWRDAWTIGLVCASVPLFCIFVAVETWVASEPFAPKSVIFERALIAAYLCNFWSMAGIFGMLFYVPLYFQAFDDLSATQAGTRLVPGVAATVTGSLFGGFYMKRTGKYYWITVCGYSATVIGLGLVLIFTGLVVNSTAGIICGMMVAAFGNGVGVTTTLIGLIANAGHENQAIATACSYLFRSLGSTFGLSLSATAANQTLRSRLQSRLGSGEDAEKIARAVRQSLEYLKELEPSIREAVRQAYAESTRTAFALQIVLASGAALSAWWIREAKLSR